MHHPTPAQVAYMTAHASDDRRGWIIGVNILCLLLAAGAVALRLASRIKIGTKIGLDDGLVCAAWVSSLLFFLRLSRWTGGVWTQRLYMVNLETSNGRYEEYEEKASQTIVEIPKDIEDKLTNHEPGLTNNRRCSSAT